MPDTTIFKFTAPTLTDLTAVTAQTESTLNGLTTATVAATTSAPLIWQQLIHTS